MRNTIIFYALILIMVVAMVDMAGFLMWAVSGQTPPDSFYIGALTGSFFR